MINMMQLCINLRIDVGSMTAPPSSAAGSGQQPGAIRPLGGQSLVALAALVDAPGQGRGGDRTQAVHVTVNGRVSLWLKPWSPVQLNCSVPR